MTLAVNIAQSGSNNVTFRNRIINGAMVIDQRNAGASITPTNGQYCVDRWQNAVNVSSKYSCQQVADAPAGFTYSLKATSLSAYTIGAGELAGFRQYIEGYNIADLNEGTANAKSFTLSFWVKSSLTGTFGGVVSNDNDRTWAFTYTISSANTWKYETITITGQTGGTWLTTNGAGLSVIFSLACGSTYLTTPNQWNSNNSYGATGQGSVLATNSATWQVTGVQLEAGTTASPFEYRQYGTELALCQRYFEKSFAQGTAPAEGVDNNFQTGGAGYATNGLYIPNVGFKVTKRTTATVTIFRPNVVATAGNFAVYSSALGGWNSSTTTVNSANDTTFSVNLTSNINVDKGYAILGAWTASAEL
jgi:hypothetical protein